VEFTGENQIDHTPKDETIRVYTGNAFDISGERRQTPSQSHFGVQGFVRTTRRNPTVRVVEHLYRWSNWAITKESASHRQTDSRTIEYEVALAPDQERTLTYTAHYTW
jgi:hypothetical protein